jgi:hypothetical protein
MFRLVAVGVSPLSGPSVLPWQAHDPAALLVGGTMSVLPFQPGRSGALHRIRSPLDVLLVTIRERAFDVKLTPAERQEITRLWRAIGWTCVAHEDQHNAELERSRAMERRVLERRR